MRGVIFSVLSVLLLPLYASATAMFRGRVVEIADQPKQPGLIFVMGRNGSLRKVQVSKGARGIRRRHPSEIPQNAAV